MSAATTGPTLADLLANPIVREVRDNTHRAWRTSVALEDLGGDGYNQAYLDWQNGYAALVALVTAAGGRIEDAFDLVYTRKVQP